MKALIACECSGHVRSAKAIRVIASREDSPTPKKFLWEQDADNAAAGAKAVREILEGGPGQEGSPVPRDGDSQ